MMIPDFAALCLMLFVTIDDHYRALPPDLQPRGEQAGCSDSELLAMLRVSECMGWHRETEHVSQWACHCDLFPHQPDRPRLHRRRASSTAVTALRGRVLPALALALDRQCVVDSVPVPVMGYPLVPGAHNAGTWRSCGRMSAGSPARSSRTTSGQLRVPAASARHAGRGDSRLRARPRLSARCRSCPRTARGSRRSGGVGGQGVPQRPACRDPAAGAGGGRAHAAPPQCAPPATIEARLVQRERFIPALKGACPPSWCGDGRGEGTICHQGTKTLGNEPNQTCFFLIPLCVLVPW